MRPHKCDGRCVCHEHETPQPLYYDAYRGEHACSDLDCVNAHGMTGTYRQPPTTSHPEPQFVGYVEVTEHGFSSFRPMGWYRAE